MMKHVCTDGRINNDGKEVNKQWYKAISKLF